MNIIALETFLAIIETGSLVRASERLNVAQSTVTARLKALEEDLGQTLLQRHKSPVALTSSGYKFKRYAETMTDLWRQARQETSLPEGIEAVFNLGCHPDLWPGLGRQMIDELRGSHPETALSAWQGEAAQLEEWLGTGRIDAMLTYRQADHEGWTTHALRGDRLVVAATRPDNPLRFDPDYIYVDAGEEFGRRHTAAYADAGIARVSFGSAAWAMDYLLEHGGSAYLPERLAAPHIAAGQLHQIDEAPVFMRNVYLTVNDAAAANWPWMPDMIAGLSANGAHQQ